MEQALLAGAKRADSRRKMSNGFRTEGLGFYRLLMVLSSMAPLFVLLALRGVPKVNGHAIGPNLAFVVGCILLAGLPAGFIALRLRTARTNLDTKEIKVGASSDAKDHLLVYLFAMLIPLYQTGYSSIGEVWAAGALVVLIVFLFWHHDLHYMNLLFALAGYRVFTVSPPDDPTGMSGKHPLVVLAKRHHLRQDEMLRTYRISNSVYIDQG